MLLTEIKYPVRFILKYIISQYSKRVDKRSLYNVFKDLKYIFTPYFKKYLFIKKYFNELILIMCILKYERIIYVPILLIALK